MHRFFVILAIVGVSLGAIVPQSEVRDDQMEQASKISASVPNNQLQAYSSVQSSHLPSQYYYPTYPEYGNNNNGYAAQSGYEGYLIPAAASPQRNSDWVSDIATSLLPLSSQVIVYGARAGAYLLHLLFAIVLGGAFTTLVCTFTPLCTINFMGLGLNKNQVKEQVAELARAYITPESVNAATILVSKAIDKYNAMQKEHEESKQEEIQRPIDDSNLQ